METDRIIAFRSHWGSKISTDSGQIRAGAQFPGQAGVEYQRRS